jgi:hydrogenase nickel incorporation protein HypA/HybF
MHELSIAQALMDLAVSHAPAGAVVRSLRICAGPLRGIDPEALRWAWSSVTAGHALHEAELDVQLLPWRLRCPRCAVEWTSDLPDSPCSCGCDAAYPVGGDELRLDSLEVDDPPN